jgi:hypothetical protein
MEFGCFGFKQEKNEQLDLKHWALIKKSLMPRA